MAGSKPSLGELVGTTGSWQDARQSCMAEGPTGSIRKETGSSSSGLLQSTVRVWRGPSSTAHPTLTYPVTAAFLWSRERRVVRDTSPVTLTSIKGERKDAPQRSRRGRSSTAGVAGVCPALGLLHRLFSAKQAWKALRWFWRTSPPAAGNSAFQEWFLACRHRSSTQRPLTAKPPGHQPWGMQRK